MAPLFTLRTLGVPQLLAATGESIRFRTRKHFALAIRLGVEPGRPLTRDHLIELLWSSSPPRLGRHSLAQAVTVLKAKLGRAHVLVHKSTLTLAPGVVDCDVAHLDDCSGGIEGPFLESFEIPRERAFDDWRDAWHARLLPRMRDCLVRMMDGGRRIGDFATVERHAQVLADLDPLSEDALRGIMEARAWVGDRTNALKAYAQFETRLAKELGARPSPELARIANLLREGRRSPYRQPSEPPPEAGEKRFEPERVIGREKEFSQLYDAWIGVRRRQPCVMVVTGDPGIGKTTLTNAFVSTCQMEGAVVARAQAYDAERELPFAVLAELVRQLTIQRAIGSADPEALSELSRICADVLAAFPGVPKPVEWSAEITPLRLADAFLKTISAAAEDSPLVLVVDDVHAADNASLAILHNVARKLGPSRVALILTCRATELAGADAAQALTTDDSLSGLRVMELEPFDPESATGFVHLLTHESGQEPADSVSERILSASGGNPLALELLTREWLARGADSLLSDLDRLNTVPAASLGIPRAIRAAFERQSQRLDGKTRAALDLASVLGRRISDLAIYGVVDLQPIGAATALVTLRERGFLREVHGELEFRNELLRAQAYYSITAVARQHLHRSIAESLTRRDGPVDATLEIEIAWHFIRAGEWLLAAPHALRGADSAVNAGAPREAEQLLQLLLARKELPMELLRLVEISWCRALIDQSRAGAALPTLERLAEHGTLAVSQLAEVTRLLATAEYLVNRETGQKHATAADTALRVARQSKDLDLIVKALFEYARSGAEGGEESRVQAACEQLQAIVPSLMSRGQAIGHYALAYCEYFLFNIQAATDRLTNAIGQLESERNDVLLQLAYTGVGICHYTLCSIEQATDAFEKGLKIANKLGDDSRASVISGNLSAVMLLAGDFAEAIRWGRESVARGERALNQPMLRNAYGNLTEAYLLAGMREEALRVREASTAWVQRERSWHARLVYTAEDACHQLILGNLPAALSTTTILERLAAGRERAVPPVSSYEMLLSIKERELQGAEAALRKSVLVSAKYAGKVPLAHLTALCVEASLRQIVDRAVPESIATPLEALLTRAPGRRILYQTIGLLT